LITRAIRRLIRRHATGSGGRLIRGMLTRCIGRLIRRYLTGSMRRKGTRNLGRRIRRYGTRSIGRLIRGILRWSIRRLICRPQGGEWGRHGGRRPGRGGRRGAVGGSGVISGTRVRCTGWSRRRGGSSFAKPTRGKTSFSNISIEKISRFDAVVTST
jgi:hypothetical protein